MWVWHLSIYQDSVCVCVCVVTVLLAVGDLCPSTPSFKWRNVIYDVCILRRDIDQNEVDVLKTSEKQMC